METAAFEKAGETFVVLGRIEAHPAAINTYPITRSISHTDVNVNQLTHLRMGLTAEALRRPHGAFFIVPSGDVLNGLRLRLYGL